MSQQRILVVDDELHIRRLLGNTLARAGYAVLEAASARDAMRIADAETPDAALLDLGLPDRDGLELVPLLKKRGRMAVIVISAREATDDKVAALDLGADDYVTKPFDTEELLARLRASLRHRVNEQGADAVITAGTLRIDLANRDISRDGAPIKLTRKEFDVLSQLVMAPGRVVTHQRILAAAWPTDQDGHVEYLRIVVRNLRQKIELDPASPRLIVNELGVGYRFMADA
ncbi:response regulator [Sandarakinorhabdus sp. DWP1-3-1]|uniref:response regulator n=1 Tax=Sandarakinorhabdus sp. DWP1-3-1 TaxID=2804627 RepID=UPI003CFA4CDD